MIKSLKIENFQSHLNSYLELSDGINVISGQSNNGKSSILRSLSWVIFNRPLGLSFKSSFSNKKDIVKITINTETDEIVREKNDTINQYKINNIILDTVGSNCPDEIASVLNFSELNIQSQFEKHFLITESAGEVGRTINGFLKLDAIDALISNISSKITSTNKELEIKKQDLDKLNTSLEKFEDFDLIENLVNQIIEYDSKIKDLENKVKILSYIVTEGVRVEAIIASIENKYDGFEEEIKSLEQLWLDYNTNSALISDLKKIVTNIKELDSRIEASEAILNHGVALQEIENNVIKYLATSEVLDKIIYLKQNWDGYFESMKKDEKLIEKEEKEFNDLLKEYGCPLCGKVN